MATSTFDRRFEIPDIDSYKRMLDIAYDEVPVKELTMNSFSREEVERRQRLLEFYLQNGAVQ